MNTHTHILKDILVPKSLWFSPSPSVVRSIYSSYFLLFCPQGPKDMLRGSQMPTSRGIGYLNTFGEPGFCLPNIYKSMSQPVSQVTFFKVF